MGRGGCSNALAAPDEDEILPLDSVHQLPTDKARDRLVQTARCYDRWLHGRRQVPRLGVYLVTDYPQ
jgi:hypothetical protein